LRYPLKVVICVEYRKSLARQDYIIK